MKMTKYIIGIFLLVVSTAHAEVPTEFYDLPIPKDAEQFEKKDELLKKTAQLRFATRSTPAEMIQLYKAMPNVDITERKMNKTTILMFKTQHGYNRMISVTDYYGVADIILQVEKSK